jgi:hypothetical protein
VVDVEAGRGALSVKKVQGSERAEIAR